MFADFDAVFHPETKWENKILHKNSPCNNCEIYEEVERKRLYGTIAERQYTAMPESCKTCKPRLLWEADCFAKLCWYEENDVRFKDTEAVKEPPEKEKLRISHNGTIQVQKSITVDLEIELDKNDIFNWLNSCENSETLKYLGRAALNFARAIEDPDTDDFRSRA